MESFGNRIDDFEYEDWNELLDPQGDADDEWYGLGEKQKLDQIRILEQSLVEQECLSCLSLLYWICPSIIQPVFKPTHEINTIIENVCYKSLTDEQFYQYSRIYNNLHNYFFESNNPVNEQENQENSNVLRKDNQTSSLTLFNYSMIVDNIFFLVYVLLFHLFLLILIFIFMFNFSFINFYFSFYCWFNCTIFCFEIWNIIHVTMDIVEYNQWNGLFVNFYDWIFVLSQFENEINRCLNILSNQCIVGNGYSLCSDTRNIPIDKLENHDDDSKNKLNELRNTIYSSLFNINNNMQTLIYHLSGRVRKNSNKFEEIEKTEIDSSHSSNSALSLQQLYQQYQYYRICRKLLLTQIYRITDVYSHSYYIYKSLRKYLCFGCIFMFLKMQNNNCNRFEYYLNSPFSPTMFHFDFNPIAIAKCVYHSFQCLIKKNNDTDVVNPYIIKLKSNSHSNGSNKLIVMNIELHLLSNKMRKCNGLLTNIIKLNKSPRTLDQLKMIELKKKIKSQKKKESKKNNKHNKNNKNNNSNNNNTDEPIATENNAQSLLHIHDSLKRLQSKIDEVTCHIYTLDQILTHNPQSLINCCQNQEETEEKSDSVVTASNLDSDKLQKNNDNNNNNNSIEVMENLVRRLNSAYNEWKYILSNINPDHELLSKYPGFSQVNWSSNNANINMGGYYRRRARHLMDETVIDYNEQDGKINSEENSREKQKRMLMASVLSKLQSKSRSKLKGSYITEDGEEMFEDDQDYSIKNAATTAPNDIDSKIKRVDISLNANNNGGGGSGIDNSTFVNELQSVLKHRKKINKKQYDSDVKSKELNANEESKNKNNNKNEENTDNEEIFELDNDKVKHRQPNQKSLSFAFNPLQLSAALNKMNAKNKNGETEKGKEKEKETRLGFNDSSVGLLARLVKENAKERESVLNGTCNDFEIEFKLKEDEIVFSDSQESEEINRNDDDDDDNSGNNKMKKDKNKDKEEEVLEVADINANFVADNSDDNEEDDNLRNAIMNRPTIDRRQEEEDAEEEQVKKKRHQRRKKRMRHLRQDWLLDDERKTPELKAMTEEELGDNTTLEEELARKRFEIEEKNYAIDDGDDDGNGNNNSDEIETMEQILSMNGINTIDDEYVNDIDSNDDDYSDDLSGDVQEDEMDDDIEDFRFGQDEQEIDNESNENNGHLNVNDNDDNDNVDDNDNNEDADDSVTKKKASTKTKEYQTWTTQDIADLAKELGSDSD